MSRSARLARLSVVVGTCAGAAAAQMSYTLVDLGLPPGEFNIFAVALSEDGRALVYSSRNGGATRSYLWHDGVFTDLGLFNPNLLRNEASDINASGVISGSSWSTNGYPAESWIWKGGTYTELPTLGGPYSNAYSINDAGQVTGWADTTGDSQLGRFHAFLYDADGTIHNLCEIPGSRLSTGYSVNASGQVACSGSAAIDSGWARAAIADLVEGMHDLGTLGGPRSFVRAINDHGHAVGSSDVAGSEDPNVAFNIQHAFLWRDGVMVDLGVLPGFPLSFGAALNNADVCVGGALESTSGGQRRAVRFMDGEVTDINELIPPGGEHLLLGARAINDAGQILVLATLNGENRVVLLTPEP